MAFLYSSNSSYIPEWNDNKQSDKPILFKLKSLKIKDYWKVMTICKKIEENKDNIKPDDIVDICEELKPVFTEYVVSVENINIDNKQPQPADLIDYPFLFELIIEVLLALVNVSSFTEQDKKKLDM